MAPGRAWAPPSPWLPLSRQTDWLAPRPPAALELDDARNEW